MTGNPTNWWWPFRRQRRATKTLDVEGIWNQFNNPLDVGGVLTAENGTEYVVVAKSSSTGTVTVTRRESLKGGTQ